MSTPDPERCVISRMNLSTILRGNLRPVKLRWSEAPNARIREASAELLRTHVSETVLRSSREVAEKTKVYLENSYYKGKGVVRSCVRLGTYFVLRILMVPEKDPGVLAVEDFVTEEQERRILEQLQGYGHVQPRHRAAPAH